MAQAPIRRKTTQQALDDSALWKPPSFENADAAAIQALAQGRASTDQQKRALGWIVGDGTRGFKDSACGTYDSSWRPGGAEGARESDFAAGRRFVGLQIVKLIHLKIGALPQRREDK